MPTATLLIGCFSPEGNNREDDPRAHNNVTRPRAIPEAIWNHLGTSETSFAALDLDIYERHKSSDRA